MPVINVGDEFEFMGSANTGQLTVKDAGQRGGVNPRTIGGQTTNIPIDSPVSDMWFRCLIAPSAVSVSATNALVYFYLGTASSGTVFTIKRHSLILRKNCTININGEFSIPFSLWTDGITTFYDMCIHLKSGPSGRLRIWLEGKKVIDFPFVSSTTFTWDAVQLYSPGINPSFYGGMILSYGTIENSNIINAQVHHKSPSGVGFYNAWNGSAANLRDDSVVPRINTTTFRDNATVGDKFTHTYDTMYPVNQSRIPMAVTVAANGSLSGGGGISALNYFARFSGVDYNLGTYPVAGVPMTTFTLSSDPAGNPWTVANIDAVEWGINST
jgi:hypothetical protein